MQPMTACKVGFFAEGEGPHLEIARHLIASVQKTMPGVPVFHLTDEKTPALGEAIRLPGDMPMGVRRITHCATHEGEWIYCDTDIVFRKDVRDVFRGAFDIAVASRKGTIWEGTRYAEIMPFNTGIVFSKNPKFFEMILPRLKDMTPEFQRWGGEQFCINELIHQQDSPFSVDILPSSFNFTPATREEDVSHASVLHYKGSRKQWITTSP